MYHVSRYILADFSHTYQKNSWLEGVRSKFFNEFHGSIRHGSGTIPKGRFLHHSFSGKENGVHQAVKKWTGDAQIGRGLVSPLYLIGDLHIPDYMCFETHGHLEQVVDGFPVVIENPEVFKVRDHVFQALFKIYQFHNLST